MITCDKCGEDKDKKKFYFDYNNKDTGRKTVCIICYNKERRPLDTKKDKRRSQNAKKVEIILYTKRAGNGLSKKVYSGSTSPTFLQFNQLIYQYVKKKHNFNYEDFNMLLLLYPVIPFTKKEYHSCRKLNSYKNTKFIKTLIEDDWIYKWKKGMYDFTIKGKRLMKDSHIWALGKKPVPDSISENIMDLFRKIQRKKR